MIRRLTASSSVAIVVACCALGAQQPDRAQTEALSRRAADRLRSLHDEADRLTSEERTVLGDLRRLELDREIKIEEFRQAEAEATVIADELAALDRQIEGIEERERLDIPDLQSRLVNLYKLGRGRYLRLLLSTTDMRRIGQASRMVAVLANQDQDRVATHQRRIEDLTASRQTLEARQTRLAALSTEIDRARGAADKAVAARNALIREIDERRDLNAALLSELLTAQQKLQSALAGMSSGSTPSLPIGPFQGDLDWPLDGTVRQRFGPSNNPRRTSINGIDIAAAEGLPVRSIHDGGVAFADVFTGFGRLVIIDHGAQTFSLYGNLKDIVVTSGVRLQRGDTLGSVGVAPTGATGLYFELRVDGRPVDPLQWLKKR